MVFQTNGRTGSWYAIGGTWVFIPDKTRSGDNLGNHTATQNLNLGASKLVGNGGTVGIAIDNAGKVGVGTTTQSEKLQVEAGNVYVHGEDQGVLVDEGVNKRAGLIKYTGKSTGLWRTDGIALAIGRVQGVGVLPGSPTAYLEDILLSNTGGVRMLSLAGTGTRLVATSASGDLSSGTATNGLSLSGANVLLGGTLTQVATIAQAGFALGLTGGNVGIGTSAPSAKLDIQGGADATGLNDPCALAFSWRNGGFRHWVRSCHNNTITGAGNAPDVYLNNSSGSAGSSAPGTGNIVGLTLESNNGLPRVGIGTTTPGATLEVGGGAGGRCAHHRRQQRVHRHPGRRQHHDGHR
ncbi:MAG: hypothetical protein H7330_07270 [Hymenobacteraceae bacterium]|nr:hypothetical protein [Hymenobacteraceae bacterium]